MKATKIMLAVLGTFLLTWLTLALVVYLFTGDATYRECLTAPGLTLTMIVFGWIPSIIVGNDVNDAL